MSTMEVRLNGGPKHNKVMAVDVFRGYVEINQAPKMQFTTATNAITWTGPYATASTTMPYTWTPPKRGRYWRTGDRDKQGRQVWAWAGWRA